MELMAAIGRRNEAETKLLALQRQQEARMTAVFSEHKKVLDKLEFERLEKRKDRDDIASSMTRWRTQWEEEMYAKNAVAAELLTLRSEFEKSSATYDKEIEGLKELVERVRTQAAEASSKWEAAVSRKNQLDVSCLTARGELQRATKKRDYEQKVLSSGGEKLMVAQAQLDKWKAQAEEAEAQRGVAAAGLEKLRSTHGKVDLAAELVELQTQLAAARAEAEMTDGKVTLANDLEKEAAALQAEHAALEREVELQRAATDTEHAELAAAHQATVGEARRMQAEAEAAREEKQVLSDELASLKAEVEELTVSHDLEA